MLRRIIVLYLLSASAALQAGEATPVDVVVYGGTAGGVMASIAAARHGAKVVLLEPGRHVGGMVSGGLGHTDMDRQERVIGGLAVHHVPNPELQRLLREEGQVLTLP